MQLRRFLTALLATTCATVIGAAPSHARVEGCQALWPFIEEAAAAKGLDAPLMAAIIQIESRFRHVVNKRSGARGLMQIMPSTARSLGCGDLDNTRANLACGADLLRRLLDRYDGSLLLALSGYQSGLKAPNKARRTGVLPPNQRYLEKVLATRTRLLREGCP
jgi:soluble lytic murein transglycosylase-like protein